MEKIEPGFPRPLWSGRSHQCSLGVAPLPGVPSHPSPQSLSNPPHAHMCCCDVLQNARARRSPAHPHRPASPPGQLASAGSIPGHSLARCRGTGGGGAQAGAGGAQAGGAAPQSESQADWSGQGRVDRFVCIVGSEFYSYMYSYFISVKLLSCWICICE